MLSAEKSELRAGHNQWWCHPVWNNQSLKKSFTLILAVQFYTNCTAVLFSVIFSAGNIQQMQLTDFTRAVRKKCWQCTLRWMSMTERCDITRADVTVKTQITHLTIWFWNRIFEMFQMFRITKSAEKKRWQCALNWMSGAPKPVPVCQCAIVNVPQYTITSASVVLLTPHRFITCVPFLNNDAIAQPCLITFN